MWEAGGVGRGEDIIGGGEAIIFSWFASSGPSTSRN
jgi:hypothetical protein